MDVVDAFDPSLYPQALLTKFAELQRPEIVPSNTTLEVMETTYFAYLSCKTSEEQDQLERAVAVLKPTVARLKATGIMGPNGGNNGSSTSSRRAVDILQDLCHLKKIMRKWKDDRNEKMTAMRHAACTLGVAMCKSMAPVKQFAALSLALSVPIAAIDSDECLKLIRLAALAVKLEYDGARALADQSTAPKKRIRIDKNF